MADKIKRVAAACPAPPGVSTARHFLECRRHDFFSGKRWSILKSSSLSRCARSASWQHHKTDGRSSADDSWRFFSSRTARAQISCKSMERTQPPPLFVQTETEVDNFLASQWGRSGARNARGA